MSARIPMAGLALLTSCSPLRVINALTPRGYVRTSDVNYGHEHRNQLDVYVPGEGTGPWPVVVFFHGGRWTFGDKAEYRFAGQALADGGFVAVLPNYRLYPRNRFPDFIEDAARAVGWVSSHIGSYGGDPDEIALMGHSAGAHLALLLHMDERWLAAEGMDAHDLVGTVGLAGAYDFLPPEPQDVDLAEMFGPPERYPEALPVSFVGGQEAPVLLAYGLRDTTVYPHNIDNLVARIAVAGGRYEARLYPRLDHGRILVALAAPLRFLGPVLEDSIAFLRAELHAKRSFRSDASNYESGLVQPATSDELPK